MSRVCKKYLFYVFVGVMVCAVSGLKVGCVTAEQSVEQQYLKFAGKMEQEQTDNRKSVEEWIEEHQIGEEEQKQKKSEVNIEDGASTAGTEQYDMQKAYQVNRLKMFLITEYQKNGFESCITDEILWKIPYDSESGIYGLALFGEEEGKFRYIGASVYNEEGHMEAIPPSDDVIAQNFQKAVSGEEIQKIQYVYSDMYCATLIYIVTSQNEYIIPYAENEDMYQLVNKEAKLQNGEVYTVETFMKEMNKLFDEKSRLEGDGDLNYGGMPYREPSDRKLWWSAVFVLMAVAVGGVVTIKKRKGKEEEKA